MWESAIELAAAIRARRRSALDVLEERLDRIRRLNPALNAIVTLDEEGARARARAADAALARGTVWGPLHGVPITVKDALETAGLRTTGGFPPLAAHVPPADATVVARMRAAGAVIVGKTNLPPLSMDFQAANPIFGRTSNPWNHERTPGGSTGGGAAAVAAGLSPLEIGSDIGGSVRLPAHYCGVLGLKPTEHRVPLTGHIPTLPGAPRSVRHMGTIGPLARTVGDLALALQVMAGPDGHGWEVPPVPLAPLPPRTAAELRLLWTDAFADVPVTDDTRQALAGLVDALAAAGTALARLPDAALDFPAAWDAWAELLQAEVGAGMTAEVEAAQAVGLRGDPAVHDPFGPGLRRGRNATLRQYVGILERRDAFVASLEARLADADALLCPVAPCPAIPHSRPGDPFTIEGRRLGYLATGIAYTTPFNLSGSPAVVVPVGRSGEGLPIGVQIVGRRWGEESLLGVAAAVAAVAGPCPVPPGCC